MPKTELIKETKEKAETLVKLFLPFMYPFHDDVAKQQAKKCAFITIDEILKDESFIDKEHLEERNMFWNEVKNHVENI